MSDFPPAGPTNVLQVIPSYLYEEYYDDDDLQAFVASYNEIAQQIIDWFNTVDLPIYTGLQGALLDWVALGLYGLSRPVLGSGLNQNQGPFNTYTPNGLPFNTLRFIGPTNYALVTDDAFKRILTWWLYRGDGKAFDIRWLKRRVMRFLAGQDGTDPPVDQTYQVSVTFSNPDVTITIYNGIRTVTGGAFFNGFAFNTMQFNQLQTTFQELTPLTFAPILQEAIDAGVLGLPFQFNFIVHIIG
jgi:hypothetical protein